MKKLIFVANLRAGRMCFFSGTPVLDFIQALETELTEWDVRILVVSNNDELKQKLARFAPNTIEAIFTVGGDGTLNRCLDALLPYNRRGIPIGILPAGTANDFAVSLGMSLTVDCVKRALSQAKTRSIDVVRVNGKPLITVGGTGIGSLLLDEVEKARQGRGALAIGALHRLIKSDLYSLLALKNIVLGNISAEDRASATFRFRATTRDDGTGKEAVHEFTTTCLMLCNQGKLGGDLSICPDSSTDDGKFELFASLGLGRAALAQTLLNFKLARPNPNSLMLRARSMVLEELDGRDIVFFGDGEIIERSSRIELGVDRGGMRVFQLDPAPATKPVIARKAGRGAVDSHTGRAAA